MFNWCINRTSVFDVTAFWYIGKRYVVVYADADRRSCCNVHDIRELTSADHLLNYFSYYLNIFAARCYASAAYAIMRCLSVCVRACLCVCPSRSCILSKRINISWFFYHWLPKPFYLFPTKLYGNIPTGTPLTAGGGVECRWGKRFSANIWLHRVLWTARLPSAIDSAATNRGKLLTLVVSKRRRLFLTVNDDEVFMTRSQSTLRRRRQSSI